MNKKKCQRLLDTYLWQLGLSSWKNMCYNSNDRVFPTQEHQRTKALPPAYTDIKIHFRWDEFYGIQ